jgi:PAS domain S-box-containing protein
MAKEQLIDELVELRQRVTELEASEAERKRVEKALRENEERFRNIYEESPIGIELYDSDGRLLHANRACLETFGVPDVAGVKGFNLFDDPNVPDEAKERLSKGEVVRYEALFDFEKVRELELYETTKSGTAYFDVLITPLGRGKEPPGGYLVQIQDITEREQAEKELRKYRDRLEELVEEHTAELMRANEQLRREIAERRQAEKMLRKQAALLDLAHDAIIVFDLDDRIVFWTPGAKETYGWTKDEALGKVTYTLLQTLFPKPLPELKADLLHAGQWEGELLHTRRDGAHIVVASRWALQRDHEGKPEAILEINRDITGRKRAEEQLQRYAADLEQINEELETFAYAISHDLRAPLASIKGFSGMLSLILEESKPILDKCLPHLDEEERASFSADFQEDLPKALGFIAASVDRMNGLIDAILHLAHLGRQKLSPEPIDMEALVQSILQSMAHQMGQRGVRVKVGTLPEVVADRVSMEQIMGNLLDNAVKYLEPGRPGEIEISAERGPEETTFHISDNGCGIAENNIPIVFDIFCRVGRQDVPGDGMGLAYVQKLVRRHGGRIWCESEPGVGTTFSFTIPSILKP